MSVHLARAQSDWHGDGMNRHSRQQVVEELLPPKPPLWRIRASDTMREFQHGHNRDDDFGIVGLETDIFKHLVCRFSQTLRGDDDG